METEQDTGFKTLPDLLLIDGGAGHVAVVQSVLDTLHLEIPVFGMVKDSHHRTRAISAGSEEISINANKSVFALVTAIQDEVHRYSIEYSRKSHGKSNIESTLLQIDGVGKARAEALWKHFKTYKAISQATIEELAAVKGITRTTAENIHSFFAQKQ